MSTSPEIHEVERRSEAAGERRESAPGAEHGGAPADPQAALRRAIAGWGRGDYGALVAELTPDCAWHAVGGASITGVHAVLDWLGAWLASSGGALEVQCRWTRGLGPRRAVASVCLRGRSRHGCFSIDANWLMVARTSREGIAEIWLLDHTPPELLGEAH